MRDQKPQHDRPDRTEGPSARLSPSLQREMEALREREEEILALLKDPKNAELFLSNPLAVLEAGRIEVPPALRRRLQKFDPDLARHLTNQTYALPNGQTVTARVKVRFTRSNGGERDGG